MPKTKTIKLIAVLCLLFPGLSFAAYINAPIQSVDFARDIEPMFKARCIQCHNAAKAMGGLRLDERSEALKVIKPGKSKESRLIHRVLGEGGEPRMPMVGDPLNEDQITRLKAWIDQGAAWSEVKSASTAASATHVKHWAFVVPKRPQVPEVALKSWVRTPIDNFVLAALSKNKLTPSAEADKATLIRRLSLDLTGLPPGVDEVDRFLADTSPGAYESLVDRLLASPHYGERWARWWLDAARYADSNGFEKDRARSMWPYRDWVINAMNRDLPFDQFTIEQLSGDLLPNPTLDQRVATGFLRNSMINEEGGVDPEQFRIEGVIDRVDAVGKAFLGLTVACAQCHSHKFDPIPHDEYYKFFAFLNKDDEPDLEVPDAKLTAKRNEILSAIAKIQDDLLAKHSGLRETSTRWEERERMRTQPEWMPLKAADFSGSNGVKADFLPDNSIRVRRYLYGDANYVIKFKTEMKGITGIRVELLNDPNLPRTGPGSSSEGLCVLSEIAVTANPAGNADLKTKVEIAGATADFSQAGAPVAQAFDGNPKTGWGIDAGPGRRNQPRQAVFVFKAPIGFETGTELTVQLLQKIGRNLNIGRFRISVTSAVDPKADSLTARISRIMSIPVAGRNEEERRELFSHFLATDVQFGESVKAIDELMKGWPYGPTTLALVECETPRETHIFKRGDWKRLGEAVTPDTPSFLHRMPQGAPRNRLGLAKWIVDKENPLTARVIVNRVWQQYYGAGLVTSPEDFGSRSEMPSHPELLDWLAVEFRENGWSLKKLHKLIVTSATYRQSSKLNPSLLEADAYNRWLSRAPRVRVDAEVVHDIALAAGGLLSPKIGGPSVFPPIPDGVLSLGYGDPMKWTNSEGEDRYRRGMYTFWKRSVPYPSLAVFDMPNADVACTRRVRSNTPLQSLTLLNDKVFMEAAQAMALRVWKSSADDRQRMRYAFKLCMAREPDQVELRRLMAALATQYANFAGSTAAAVYVASADLEKIPEDLDLHKVAAWTMISRALLNLDETITRK